MYRYHKLPFNSPFIGLFVLPEDFVSLLEHPERLKGELRFIPKSESRHLAHIAHPQNYPVAVLPTGEEIHFLHYENEEAARKKWTRRVKRIDWHNAIVKLSDNYYCPEEVMKRFDALPYPQKVLFIGRPRPELKSAVCLPEFKSEGRTAERIHKISFRHYDFARHANLLLPDSTKNNQSPRHKK